MSQAASSHQTQCPPAITAQGSTPTGGLDYEEHLKEISEVVQFVSSRMKFLPDEREEFGSFVHVRLLQNRGAILHKFQGRCRFRTYLVTVVMRLALDFRRRTWGKWRPSKAAARLGPTAIRLETLLYRDGRSFEESVGVLLTSRKTTATREELEEVAARLPIRSRPRFEAEEVLADLAASDPTPEATLLESERRERFASLLEALNDAMEDLSRQERVILRLFFVEGFRWKEIGESLGYAPKPFYAIKDRALASLRAKLKASGISHGSLEFPKRRAGNLLWGD